MGVRQAGTGTGQSFVERMTSAVRSACQIPWVVLDLSLSSEEKTGLASREVMISDSR